MSDQFVSETHEEEEYEEISCDEVDRVVLALEGLIESSTSENIKAYLEEASSNIFYLVYEDAEDDNQAEAA